MTTKFHFTFSFDTNLFTVFVNKHKLVEFNLNILNNNLSITLSCEDLKSESSSNLNELIYLIIDHLKTQNANVKNFHNFLKISPEFRSALGSFLYKQRIFQFENKLKNSLSLRTLDLNFELKAYWLNIFNKNTSNANKTEVENSILLAKMYHQLIHSDFMNLIIKYEYLNTFEYNQKYNQFLLSSNNNELWSSRIESLKHKQQRQFSKFLFKLYDEFTNQKLAKENLNEYIEKSDFDDFEDFNVTSMTRVKILDENKLSKRSSRVLKDTSFNRIEESYTIQLGAQMKSTHNLRLIRCDIFEYCKDRFKSINPNEMTSITDCIEPHSMLTAMSLYSANKINALVLLVDNHLENVNNFSSKTTSNESDSNDTSQSFKEICNKNGYDFHFQSVEEQIQTAIKCINSINKVDSENFAQLNIGDFYVTKHSNLSQTHVVFHLAAFDKTNESNNMKQSDLSSRHPVILGLRNILKTCIQNNVQTITFPLLLTHQMTEVDFYKSFRQCFKLVSLGNDRELGNEKS